MDKISFINKITYVPYSGKKPKQDKNSLYSDKVVKTEANEPKQLKLALDGNLFKDSNSKQNQETQDLIELYRNQSKNSVTPKSQYQQQQLNTKSVIGGSTNNNALGIAVSTTATPANSNKEVSNSNRNKANSITKQLEMLGIKLSRKVNENFAMGFSKKGKNTPSNLIASSSRLNFAKDASSRSINKNVTEKEAEHENEHEREHEHRKVITEDKPLKNSALKMPKKPKIISKVKSSHNVIREKERDISINSVSDKNASVRVSDPKGLQVQRSCDDINSSVKFDTNKRNYHSIETELERDHENDTIATISSTGNRDRDRDKDGTSSKEREVLIDYKRIDKEFLLSLNSEDKDMLILTMCRELKKRDNLSPSHQHKSKVEPAFNNIYSKDSVSKGKEIDSSNSSCLPSSAKHNKDNIKGNHNYYINNNFNYFPNFNFSCAANYNNFSNRTTAHIASNSSNTHRVGDKVESTCKNTNNDSHTSSKYTAHDLSLMKKTSSFNTITISSTVKNLYNSKLQSKSKSNINMKLYQRDEKERETCKRGESVKDVLSANTEKDYVLKTEPNHSNSKSQKSKPKPTAESSRKTCNVVVVSSERSLEEIKARLRGLQDKAVNVLKTYSDIVKAQELERKGEEH